MLNVPIDRIVPLTDARDNFSRIVADIENQKDGLYVLTKGGKPAIALINISYLSELMNGTAILPQPHSQPATPPQAHETKEPKHETLKDVPEKQPEIKKPIEQVAPKIETPQPSEPKTPPMPPKPVAPVAPNPINPTWTGQQNNTPPSVKPASPWPIPSATPSAAPLSAPKPPIEAPSAAVAPKPIMPPPMPVVAPPMPAQPVTPKPTIPPPPPPPNPVSAPLPVAVKTTPDLPPPPNNPTTIPFDEAPKTMLEPGEEPIAPAPALNNATEKPAATPPTPPPSVPTTPASSVQDIDI